MKIDLMNESNQKIFFENIDRIINATRIEGMQELKKLIKFITHLIDTIIHQIIGGNLSEKAAKIKILNLFSIVHHCQIGNHPAIKASLERLKRTFENRFKPAAKSNWLNFKPKPVVLSNESIQHYVEIIKDSQNDPVYSENPKSLIDAAEKVMAHIPESTVDVSKYYLSKLIERKENYEKIKQYINAKEIEKNEQKKPSRINFNELNQSYRRSLLSQSIRASYQNDIISTV